MVIRNIWAIGRNYPGHVKEMNQLTPDQPMIFLKAGSSATVNSRDIILPYWCEEIHHEVELALHFSQSLRIIEAAVALDLTERKIQTQAKQNGWPWTLAKSFEGACPVSAFFSIRNLDEVKDVKLRLWVNDQLRQEARTSEMIFSLEEQVNYISEKFPICGGDLILTGTPAGVGPLKNGDTVKAEIEGMITHTWKCLAQPTPQEKKSS